MFRRIVVGADGTAEGKDAVVLGAAIAAATDSGLTLLGAFPQLPILDGDHRSAQAASVNRQLSALRRQFAPSAHITSVANGNCARALLTEARSWRANLIVIGSSRHAALGHCALGQTGRRLLNEMPAALAIAKRGLQRQGFTLSNIAVGYDGSPEAGHALQFADRLADDAKAELSIETVLKDPVPASPQGRPPTPAARESREAARLAALKIGQSAAARTASASHVNASIGEPGAVLREISEGVDLMVIGSRRWGLLPRVLLGGVGEALATDCGSSLIIASVPPDRSARMRRSGYGVPDSIPTSTPSAGETIRP